MERVRIFITRLADCYCCTEDGGADPEPVSDNHVALHCLRANRGTAKSYAVVEQLVEKLGKSE
eukprot:1794688-Amphidinium_carterae.1